MYGVARAMLPNQIIGSASVDAEALLRLELLLGERVVDLTAVTDIVAHDGGLKTHVLQLVHDCAPTDGSECSIHEYIVEIGIERLRESLRQTRFRLKAN